MATWRDAGGADLGPVSGRSVVTIGNFDGVHRGHRHVVDRCRELAAALAPPVPTVVAVTFDPHPVQVFAPERAPVRLTSLTRRVRLLRDAGADEVRVLAFDHAMAAWSPEEFVRRVLVDDLHAAAVVVGENFRFGHRAAGDVALLQRLGEEHDFVAEGLALDGGDEDHSSTLVRRLVATGDVTGAADVLGRPFAVEGEVVRGDQRGREIGYPTANVPVVDGEAVPADGVYAGWFVRASGERLPAAVSVGTNPTFDGTERRVESYVMASDGSARHDLDLYGEHVVVEFVLRLRAMERYDGLDALLEQMAADVDDARRALGVQ
ncbi:bifunctional riboflavin kinase/FAD synthetase [Aeromicrobium marinum]|uniref:bifunctional riboflavin kinase/FAD synthetase n=1 Tax=Aeromicrobium marinum TaxID=219314 RepID=UPI0012E9A7AF|nr:bifunctional riboflavin kinase/FAD synthetase [Aeromicrobium marinum]